MPLFEFECEKCHFKKEELLKQCPAEIECEKCGGKMKRTYDKASYASNAKSRSCSGDCKHCGGCV